jgi:glycosyltransferase involved in cell wall biosynthesis
MTRADIVVRPSLTEGMPLTILEAMSSRRCVLASAIPANAELVRDGETGMLHRPGDAEDLAAQLQRLIENDELRERLADAAVNTARAYTWDRTAAAHGSALLTAARR